MLKNLLHLPVIIFGDFNIDIQDLRNSGFLQAHSLIAIEFNELPGGGAVTNGKRKIEYVLCSGTMYTAMVKVQRITNVPFGPHYGYFIKLNGAAIVSGTRLHIPKPLPLEQYQLKAACLSQRDEDQHLHNAKNRTLELLRKQKHKTSFAILEQPLPHLTLDKNTKGQLQQASIQVGEQLALSALQIICSK